MGSSCWNPVDMLQRAHQCKCQCTVAVMVCSIFLRNNIVLSCKVTGSKPFSGHVPNVTYGILQLELIKALLCYIYFTKAGKFGIQKFTPVKWVSLTISEGQLTMHDLCSKVCLGTDEKLDTSQ